MKYYNKKKLFEYDLDRNNEFVDIHKGKYDSMSN